MNEQIQLALPDEQWAEDFVRAIREQRSRVQEFLVSLRRREQCAHAELTSLIGQCQGLNSGAGSAGDGTAALHEAAGLRTERDQLAARLSASTAGVTTWPWTTCAS